MATLILTDRTKTDVSPADNRKFQEQEVRTLLGGNFRIEPLREGTSALIQDGKGLNKEAMRILKASELLFGNVLVVSKDEYNPDEE